MTSLRMGKLFVAIGIIIVIFGLTFHLQGQSVMGPESSFMYSNPDWITYGIQIMLVGSLVVIIGITIHILKRN